MKQKIYRIKRDDTGEFLSSFRRMDEQREDWDWCNTQGTKAYEDQITFEFFFWRNDNKAWETVSETEAVAMRRFLNHFSSNGYKLDIVERAEAPAPF